MLSAKRDAKSAERFFRNTFKVEHNSSPRVINVDKNAAYPKAIDKLQADQTLPKTAEVRRVKYLNNILEQDHRAIKRLVNPGMGFRSFNTARRTLRGYEAMNMIRKGQIQGVEKGVVLQKVVKDRKLFEKGIVRAATPKISAMNLVALQKLLEDRYFLLLSFRYH